VHCVTRALLCSLHVSDPPFVNSCAIPDRVEFRAGEPDTLALEILKIRGIYEVFTGQRMLYGGSCHVKSSDSASFIIFVGPEPSQITNEYSAINDQIDPPIRYIKSMNSYERSCVDLLRSVNSAVALSSKTAKILSWPQHLQKHSVMTTKYLRCEQDSNLRARRHQMA
jgi:hypothetical protein